jgi:hypothetical protein
LWDFIHCQKSIATTAAVAQYLGWSFTISKQISDICVCSGAEIGAHTWHCPTKQVVIKVCTKDGFPLGNFIGNISSQLVVGNREETDTGPQSNGRWQ